VTVNVPVVQPVDPQLTQDCIPAAYPDKITIGAIIDRLVSVEDCLAQTRGQLAKIRQ
jgi:hypothetical protein